MVGIRIPPPTPPGKIVCKNIGTTVHVKSQFM